VAEAAHEVPEVAQEASEAVHEESAQEESA